MLKGLTLRRWSIIIVTVPVLVSIIFIAFLVSALKDAERELKAQILGAKLAAVVANLQGQSFQAALQGKTWHSSRSEDAGQRLDKSLASIQRSEGELRELLKDDEKQKYVVANVLADSE